MVALRAARRIIGSGRERCGGDAGGCGAFLGTGGARRRGIAPKMPAEGKIMGIPVQQALTIGTYVLKQRLKGRKRFPLVLMLESLYRCNLACVGCGKIQHPEEILSTYLTPEQCWAAAEECGAPVVSIAGGEPLVHPQIDRMVHRPGVFDKAVAGIREAKRRGFRVSTNTTVYAESSPEEIRQLVNFVTDELHVDGMMVSPGYDYPKAPNQNVFLKRPQMIQTFRQLFSFPDRRRWRFNQTPLFLDFLQGKRALQCAAWASPTRGVLGWQRPCYLIGESYVPTFKELLEETEWERYGYGRDARCTNCMMHCGYEMTAANAALESPLDGLRAGASTLFGRGVA